MARITVEGISLAYELAGVGDPIAWFQGGFAPRNEFSYVFAGRLSANNRVFTWDPPNSGVSDVVNVLRPWAERRYFDLAAAARTGGMEAAVEASRQPPDAPMAWSSTWLSSMVSSRSECRDIVLAMDPATFSATMERWGNWMASPRLHVLNLDKDTLYQVTVPAIVAHGLDENHIESTAREVCDSLPNAEWAEYSSRYSQSEISDAKRDNSDWSTHAAFRMPFYDDFLRSVRKAYQ